MESLYSEAQKTMTSLESAVKNLQVSWCYEIVQNAVPALYALYPPVEEYRISLATMCTDKNPFIHYSGRKARPAPRALINTSNFRIVTLIFLIQETYTESQEMLKKSESQIINAVKNRYTALRKNLDNMTQKKRETFSQEKDKLVDFLLQIEKLKLEGSEISSRPHHKLLSTKGK